MFHSKKPTMNSHERPMCAQGDSGLVLTTDPKPRLRWTVELHDRFVDAVSQLGGPDSTHLFQFSPTPPPPLFSSSYPIQNSSSILYLLHTYIYVYSFNSIHSRSTLTGSDFRVLIL